MATSQLPQLGANADFDQVKSVMLQWQEYLTWFFRNLDSLNIKSLTAEKIKAGKMIGFVIQTNEDGAYPNIIFSSTTDLIQAFSDADHHVDMTADSGSPPGFAWYSFGDVTGVLYSDENLMTLASFNGSAMLIQSDANLTVRSSAMNLIPTGPLTINGSSGQTGTVYVSATPGGVANIPITFTKGIRTS